MKENDIGNIVVETAITIHRELGPGLLESVYEEIMAYELRKIGLMVKQQANIPIKYKSITLDKAFRADIIINDKVLLELKSVETINNAHKKQLLTYLKLTGCKLGYLLDFRSYLMKNGITRVINGNINKTPVPLCLREKRLFNEKRT